MSKEKPVNGKTTVEAPKTEATLVAPVPDTIESVEKSIRVLMAKGDIDGVVALGEKRKGLLAAKAQVEAEAKRKALEAITLKVRGALLKVVSGFVADKTLDGADGVWFNVHFGEMVDGQHVASLTLLTPMVSKTASTRKGVGKANGATVVRTSDVVANNAGKLVEWKGLKQTVQAAWNSIQAIRESLPKLDDTPGSGAKAKDGSVIYRQDGKTPWSKRDEIYKFGVNNSEWQLKTLIVAGKFVEA